MSVLSLVQLQSQDNFSVTDGIGLNETVVLNAKGPVSFHWTDFQESCRDYQARIERDSKLKVEYHEKVAELNKLQLMPVWIRSAKEVTHTNLYDLYQDFILERLWHTDAAHPHAPYDISFISPSGPYKKLAVTDCFNLQTYQDFIMVNLLQGKLPQRDFRLRTPSRLLMEYGNGYREAGLIDLEQVTSTGLLLRCNSKTFFQGVRPHGRVRLMFNSRPLDEATQGAFNEKVGEWKSNPFYTHNKQESFLLSCSDFQVASRFDFGHTSDVYLFVSFNTLKAANTLMTERLERFVARGRESLRVMLKKKAA